MKSSTKIRTPAKTRARGAQLAERARAKRTAPKGAQGDPDALALLRRQHRQLESLLARFDRATSDDEAQELADELCDKLTVHNTIEEEIFYPAARNEDTNDLVLESAEEHLSVKRLIADLQQLEADDERLRPKVNLLREQLSQHVHKEETELFPKVRKEMEAPERHALGKHLRERAAELEGPTNGVSAHTSWPQTSNATDLQIRTRRSH
jgi:iron-sulfur cluster repair protein YtfE (RIC family)